MSSGKCRPYCPGLNVLKLLSFLDIYFDQIQLKIIVLILLLIM